MFNNLLQYLVSHATIGIADRPLPQEIGDDAAGIVDITVKVIPMLNSA